MEDYKSRKCLLIYVSWLKALHNWFHAAHHVSSGVSFAGDHVDLFGRIYQEIEDEIDGAIEKVVGLTNDPRMACPILINKTVIKILSKYQSPVYDSQEEIVKNALNLESDYLLFLEQAFKILDKNKTLSLGLNDHLSASANKHETFLYLLKRRNENSGKMLKENYLNQKKYNLSVENAAIHIVNDKDFESAFYAILDIWEDEIYDRYMEIKNFETDIDMEKIAMNILTGSSYKKKYIAGSGGISYYVSEIIKELLNDKWPNIDENSIDAATYELTKKFVDECKKHLVEVIKDNYNFY